MTPDAPAQWHDVIDSTNEEARRLATSGTYGPLWIAARQQTAGRGRLGRSWVSPAGNLFCTALFREPAGVGVATRFPFAAGLTVTDICSMLVPGADVRLKWPNDVRVSGAKLCGILVEAGQVRTGGSWVATGMGINVRNAPERAGQAATCLADLGAADLVTADVVLDALRPAFANRIRQAREDFPSLLQDWEAKAEALGQQVTTGKGAEAVSGTFVGLAADGGLKLQLSDGSQRIIRAGDVELVKEVGGHAARD